jgi:hypothetical protein
MVFEPISRNLRKIRLFIVRKRGSARMLDKSRTHIKALKSIFIGADHHNNEYPP